MSTLRTFLRRSGLGRLVYLLWFKPMAYLRSTRKLGGWRRRLEVQQAEAQLCEAATRLVPAIAAEPSPLTVYYLTGKRFWQQSAFCAWSLAKASGRTVQPQFFDDGSLSAAASEQLQRLFPATRIHTHTQCLARLHAQLPAVQYPQLHALWTQYPNIRKLIDPHLLGGGWKLVLDSDMLFFARPTELLNWHDEPSQPLHMLDVGDAYGYPTAALQALSGAAVPSRVNVGVTGLDTRALDFAELEDWCARLHRDHPRHYYLEQGLIAAWMGRSGAQALPAERYRLLANRDATAGLGCLDHYVADAKPVYFEHAWRLCLQRHGGLA